MLSTCPSEYISYIYIYLPVDIGRVFEYEVKQNKNGIFTSNCKVSLIDFETQISLRTKAPPKISPSKKAFEKYKPQGLFSEFYGTLKLQTGAIAM